MLQRGQHATLIPASTTRKTRTRASRARGSSIPATNMSRKKSQHPLQNGRVNAWQPGPVRRHAYVCNIRMRRRHRFRTQIHRPGCGSMSRKLARSFPLTGSTSWRCPWVTRARTRCSAAQGPKVRVIAFVFGLTIRNELHLLLTCLDHFFLLFWVLLEPKKGAVKLADIRCIGRSSCRSGRRPERNCSPCSCLLQTYRTRTSCGRRHPLSCSTGCVVTKEFVSGS
jgi:hypothetical protein